MATAKKKYGVIRKGILQLKLRTPNGIKLTEGETSMLIDIWQQDAKVLESNEKSLVQADLAIQGNLKKIPEVLTEIRQTRGEAARFFKTTKDPIKKREWATRLVVADRTIHSIQKSQKRMAAMIDRVKTLATDATIEKKALDIRISEARAYQQIGSGIKLVGDSLIDARTRASSMEVEFMGLELGIEHLEKTVKTEDDSAIMAEARRIAGGK